VFAEPIRVVAWNIEWFPGRRHDATPEQAAAHMKQAQDALAEINPDILILTEMRDKAAVRELLSALPGFSVNAITTGGRPQQIAIASRFPAVRAWEGDWMRPFAGPPRGYAFAELKLPGDKRLMVYGVHLKSNRGTGVINRSMREASALELLAESAIAKRLWGKPGTAVLFAGDFNTNVDDSKFESEGTIRAICASGFWWPFEPLKPAKRVTWHGDDYPPIQFDHFFTWNAGRPRAKVLAYDDVSDHHPIEITVATDQVR
jgi:endonuclease/exonuclease/phosphatase family metal-dependent hydrolase